MNPTYIHLLLNHFPIIGTLIGSGLLLWGVIKNQDNLKKSAAVILVLMALIAVPVFLTGEPAEESVENIQGISEQMMEMHEDAAKIAIILMAVTGAASLIALFMSVRKKAANLVYIIALVLSLLTFAAMARTGYYGGRIRHTEIANGTNTNQQENDNGGKGDDD